MTLPSWQTRIATRIIGNPRINYMIGFKRVMKTFVITVFSFDSIFIKYEMIRQISEAIITFINI